MNPKSLRLAVGPVTRDMISPPLSPGSHLDFNTISPAVRSALDHVSLKLQRKGVHATFVVFRDKPLPIGHGNKLDTLPISPLDDPTRRSFNYAVRRAAKKFSLRRDWICCQSSPSPSSSSFTTEGAAAAPDIPNWEYIVRRSVLQNSVLFSQEGLTLLNVDHILSLKQQLSALSRGSTSHIPETIYMDSCVWLLRQIIRETGGRPFTRGFFHCAYDHLHVPDGLLVALAQEYALKHDHEAIVLPPPKTVSTKKPAERSRPGHRHAAVIARTAAMKRQQAQPSSGKVGPKTPHSASDVTPITRNEWKLLMHRALDGIKIVPVQVA